MTDREQSHGRPAGPLFFIHVPKTAGTSFRVAAERLFRDHVLRDYGRASAHTSPAIVEHVYDRRDLQALAHHIAEQGIRMIGGHVAYPVYRALVEPERVIAFVRDPVQRVVSEFLHYRRHFGFEGTLLQFARRESERNKQWKMLRALDLERAGLVGLSEHYRASLRLLVARTGLEVPYLELNSNPQRRGTVPYPLGDEEASELRRLNADDLQLYRCVAEQFSAQTGIADASPAERCGGALGV